MNYLGFNVSEVLVKDISEASTFSAMREVEQSGMFDEPWLRLRDGAPKVRRGLVGCYRHELSDEEIAFLNQLFQLEP